MIPVEAHYFATFRDDFLENIQKRSRSAKGKSHTGVSKTKKQLKKSGEELKTQVFENTEKLIVHIWKESLYDDSSTTDTPLLRAMMDEWYDIIQCGLQDEDQYQEERIRLEEQARMVTWADNIVRLTNPRYRVWEVNYADLNPKPIHIEKWMDNFYEELARKITSTDCSNMRSLSEFLSWADRSMDLIIQTWADGCVRMSTALVMWLCLILDMTRYPKFGSREEHYQCIKTFAAHRKYFYRCLTG